MTIKQKDSLSGVLFASPFLLGFAVLFVAPFLVSIMYTFTFGTGGGEFVGLKNYANVLSSEAFKRAAWNTFRFIGIGVPLIIAFSMTLSLLLQKSFAGASFFRSLFLFPLVIPIASTVMVFNLFFEQSGIINTLLVDMGIPFVEWLNSEAAFGVLIFLYIWKNCGYNIILLLAGLNSIPSDFYESATIEGATESQSFRHITIPLMAPTTFFVLVISVVNSFKSFREAYLIGGTMPHKSIYMLQHFMNHNFANLNYQRLSVAALLIFLVIFGCVFILLRLRQKAGDIQL